MVCEYLNKSVLQNIVKKKKKSAILTFFTSYAMFLFSSGCFLKFSAYHWFSAIWLRCTLLWFSLCLLGLGLLSFLDLCVQSLFFNQILTFWSFLSILLCLSTVPITCAIPLVSQVTVLFPLNLISLCASFWMVNVATFTHRLFFCSV